MLLYTWKDVERKLWLNREKWKNIINDIEIYAEEMVIHLNNNDSVNAAKNRINEILDNKYDDEKISLDLPGAFLKVVFEIEETGKKEEENDNVIPLFKNVLYQKSAYYSELIDKELPGAPVLAFHSYKGGVGRTLSVLAFVKAWSSLTDLKNPKRLLIVDADIEAPGITWLTSAEEAKFSFLDLLEVTQEKDCVDEIIEAVADRVSQLTVKIETEKSIIEHMVLPTYRYLEQLLDMYSSPESLAVSYNKKYILAEVLSRLGDKLGAELVLVDLRAGLSEFSAPLLFDPRVKKYLVTSTSYQSVKGTEILLHQLSKGLPLKADSMIPEILLTMGQEGTNVTDIISELVSVYDQYVADDNVSITDNIVTELPFAGELVHLESLEKIMKNLSGRDFYKNILEIVRNSYGVQKEVQKTETQLTRKEAIERIHDFAVRQITAEGNGAFEVLMTESIQNLIRKYRNTVPNAVIMGAKGSGKTFLYREILRSQSWEKFVSQMDKSNLYRTAEESHGGQVITIPLLASGNAGGFHEIIEQAIQNYNSYGLKGKVSPSGYIKNRDALLGYAREKYDVLGWKEIWKKVILGAVNGAYQSLEEMEEDLSDKGIKILFLIDGLEEIFQRTISSETEKNAVVALCRDLLDEVKIRCKNVGLMLFLRKDMARDSLTVNYEQFHSLYRSVELQWNSTEALRLAVWLVSQVVPDFYKEEAVLEMAPREIIDKTLHKLWGIKLGKPTSNEANSSRWILAALSDFNGQLQARDIIRFLEKATVTAGKPVYPDRYLMPLEIKKAVSDCSAEKIREIREEIKALDPIFDKLEKAPAEKKILPFHSDTFNLTQAEERIMKQEGYLRIENDKYYLPEIIRHALKFKYGTGARPKVLSLLFK
ncbi:hypothetical protein NSB25_12570 [Acetatifactor muris]|uniref:CobQ/CobB/MinD/ParA nucleotide binding domain protein n=1 Tax=Acetatifactor muris TaxID=879566 RepID=A0A2K4ZH58_9FIRM|nr:hypothetical protein [Acetatifactor muris]MCR2048122.1 hypothetical protein [Acetatifactor muris]SOY29800.1 hypothetical protein AMURIS_02521 [Acetatifactor muris]